MNSHQISPETATSVGVSKPSFIRTGIAPILCAFSLLAFWPLSTSATPVTQLKVMSFNIWVNGQQGLNRCIDVIRTSGADIVGLQECNGPTGKTIADQLGFYWTQDANSNVIVSRYPIVNRIGSTVIGYGGVAATIELSANQRVHLFDAHLNYTSYGPYLLQDGKTVNFIINNENSVRMPGLNELLGLAAPYIGLAEPVFVVGDYNAPSHLDYTAFNWPESVASINAGLSDSYRVMHPGNRKYPGPFAFDEPGITWTPVLSQEPRNAFDRIDFVYNSVNDGLGVVSSTELDHRNSVNPWPSDHRAVITTFSVTMPPQTAKASNAMPVNGSQAAPRRPLLTWVPGTGTTSHNVYFGTTSPGTLQGNQAGSSFSPGLLLPNTTYYWRIDEQKQGGVTTGDVWSFRTGNFAGAQPGKTTYTRNEAITINFSNAPGGTKDWIGIYAADGAYGNGAGSIGWAYLNGTQTAPKKAIRDGSITFPSGLPNAGSYVIRFFQNDGYYQLDAAAFTVTP